MDNRKFSGFPYDSTVEKDTVKIMFSTALFAVLEAVSPLTPATYPDPLLSCTAQRLSRFVGPYGIQQSWPLATHLPGLWSGDPGMLLSDAGQVMDGYTHHLYVNAETKSAYVVQQGGISGGQKIFGPLPVAFCSLAPVE